VGIADLRAQIVLCERRLDPRFEVAAIGFVVRMLELAPAAFWKMPAGRLLVVRTRCECAVIEQGIPRDSERDVAAV
jgi:hypothetical protein